MTGARATRVAFAWEMGANLGHLERDLPVALRLREMGAEIQFVVANLSAAEKLLAPAGISFLPSPPAPPSKRRPRPAINFSELLLEMGYDDPDGLRVRVRAWLEIWKLLSPDVVVTDFAPTAMLSAKIAKIPNLPLGPGFTIPPNCDPMPAFLKSGAATIETLRRADQCVLNAVNQVCANFTRPAFESVAQWFSNSNAQITSFAELDPYGKRAGVHYAGPISATTARRQIQWSGARTYRVFCYLHPRMSGLEAILGALTATDIEVICVIPGASEAFSNRLQSDNCRVLSEAVDLDELLPGADAVVSYGGAGLISTALLAGTPLLIVPMFMEHHLNAARATDLGAAIAIAPTAVRAKARTAIRALLSGKSYKQAARSASETFRSFDNYAATNAIANSILSLAP